MLEVSYVKDVLTSFTSFNFRIVSLSFISCSPAALPSISTSTSFFKSEALSPANLPTSVLQGDAVIKMVKKKSTETWKILLRTTYCFVSVWQTILRKTLENSCTAQVVPTILQEPLAHTNDTEDMLLADCRFWHMSPTLTHWHLLSISLLNVVKPHFPWQ